MLPSPAAIELVKQFEGMCLTAYLCPAKVPTIGYGHTRGVHLGMTITPEMADALLREDLEAAGREVAIALHVPATQAQFDALCSLAFNIGGPAVQSSTLLRKLNAGDAAGAAAEFAKWNHARGKVLAGLTRRRAAERALFVS